MHWSRSTGCPAHFLHWRLYYLGKMELVVCFVFIKTGTRSMWKTSLSGKNGAEVYAEIGGDFDKHTCWGGAKRKLWFWQGNTRPCSNPKCGCRLKIAEKGLPNGAALNPPVLPPGPRPPCAGLACMWFLAPQRRSVPLSRLRRSSAASGNTLGVKWEGAVACVSNEVNKDSSGKCMKMQSTAAKPVPSPCPYVASFLHSWSTRSKNLGRFWVDPRGFLSKK